jgi:ABC-type multidrug transport system permease subunit
MVKTPPEPAKVAAGEEQPKVEELEEYRKNIAAAEERAQGEFDKTVIALSGGALGISFVFIEKFIKDRPIINSPSLFYAWWAWAISLILVLLSYFCSIRALRRTLRQSYSGAVYVQRPGGYWSVATEVFNILGAVLFIVGLVLIGYFVRSNLPATR